MPPELQADIRQKILFEEIDRLKTSDNVLFNYSLFGFLADWMRWFWGNTTTEKWEEICRESTEAVKKYDQIYHVDSGDAGEYDGYVWFDKRNAQQINLLLKNLYSDFGVLDNMRT